MKKPSGFYVFYSAFMFMFNKVSSGRFLLMIILESPKAVAGSCGLSECLFTLLFCEFVPERRYCGLLPAVCWLSQ